jgi:hypothetical protein
MSQNICCISKASNVGSPTQESSCSLVVMPDNKKIGLLVLYAVNVV